MKRLFIPLLLIASCAQPEDAADQPEPVVEGDEMVAELGTVVGEDPGAEGAVLFADDVVEHAEGFVGAPIRVAGTIGEVCQNAGCWLTFRNDAGVAFRVVVPRDEEGYAFTFPKDISGSHAVVAGTLTVEETSVETLRHLAEDRGDDAEAIAAISEPERTLILSATGARIESDLDIG